MKESLSALTDLTYTIHVSHPDAEKAAIDKTVEHLKQRLANITSRLSERLQQLELALKQVRDIELQLFDQYGVTAQAQVAGG